MKNYVRIHSQSGITLISLVIIIIILIILAGISINTLVGENGIIIKAKEAKQNIILAGEAEVLQLNQLYYELENGGELTEDEESAKKDEIIGSLTEELDNLKRLLVQTNATEDKILKDYKAYSQGQLLTGTMIDRGAVSSSLNCGESYTIPEGYHNGLGKVSANSLASQTSATATASDILSGKTAWVNGSKLVGTANLHSIKNGSSTITANQSISIDLGGKPKFIAFLSMASFKVTIIYSETLGYVFEGYETDRGWLQITDTGFTFKQSSNWGDGNIYYIYSLEEDLFFSN